MWFELLGSITDIETIAAGNSIREVDRLRKRYGEAAGENEKDSGKSVSPMVRYVKLSSTGTRRMELGEGRSGSSTCGSKGLNKRMNEFVVCVRNEGYEVSLELRKIYQAVPDTAAARHHLLRVIDESGEDYLYPQDFFLPIELPKALEKAVLAVA